MLAQSCPWGVIIWTNKNKNYMEMFPHTFKFQVVLENFFNDFYDILPCYTLTLPPPICGPTLPSKVMIRKLFPIHLRWNRMWSFFRTHLHFLGQRVVCAKLVKIDLVILEEKTSIYKFITTSTTTDNGHIFIRKTHLTFRLSSAKII